MRPTTALEKGLTSLINVIVVSLFFLPFIFLNLSILTKKLIFIFLFFLYTVLCYFLNNGRSIGMVITKTYWKEDYPLKNQLIHKILYTASFSTLLFWIYFPFDLFLLNILFIQLPSIFLTGTTFHGYLAGKITTVKK